MNSTGQCGMCVINEVTAAPAFNAFLSYNQLRCSAPYNTDTPYNSSAVSVFVTYLMCPIWYPKTRYHTCFVIFFFIFTSSVHRHLIFCIP